MNKNLKFLTRTALLLAVAIAFQFLGRFMGPWNNFIVGPIVNAVLLIAAEITGVLGGVSISVIAPLVSALTNKAAIAPIVLMFSPFIIAGNIILVLAWHFLKKWNKIGAVGVGAVLKFGFLFTAISIFTQMVAMKPPVAATLVGLFSWPQLLTAAIGGAIALIILPVLKKALKD